MHVTAGSRSCGGAAGGHWHISHDRTPVVGRPSSSDKRARTLTVRQSGLAETTVEFENQRGEKLVGTLTDPTSVTAAAAEAASAAGGSAVPLAPPQPLPVVILAHGYMSDRHSELLVRLSTGLVRSCQLSTFRFDFSGNGESEGDFRYGQYRSEAQELGFAKRALEVRLGRRVAALLGHSKGATDALLYAGCYAQQFGQVPCIVNLAARLNVAQGVTQRLGQQVLDQLQAQGQVEMQGRSRRRGAFNWRLRQADVDDRLSTDVAAAARQIPASTAVLTVHGSDDADVPVSDARQFDTLIQNHKLVVVEGADHTFSNDDAFFKAAAAVLPFIHSSVGADGGVKRGLMWR